MGEERALLVGSGERCSEIDGQPRCKTNARVLNFSGDVEQSFHIGHADEVTANENWIVTHYSDQAMTSDYHPVDREGIAVFDATGTFLWGFESHFAGKPKLDVFHHAAAWVGADEIGVYRDLDRGGLTEFEAYIRLDLRERQSQFWRLPKETLLSSAISVVGDRVLLHSPVGRTPILGIPLSPPDIVRWWKMKTGRTRPPPSEGDIIEWNLGSDDCRVVGHFPGRGTLRGLLGGRFIAPRPDGYTILSID
jgi:hypothetical protein